MFVATSKLNMSINVQSTIFLTYILVASLCNKQKLVSLVLVTVFALLVPVT